MPKHHYVQVSDKKSYMMVETWIDTDNECWSESYHLYGLTEQINENAQTKPLNTSQKDENQ